MSYSPRTGLVYFPVMEAAFPYFPDKNFRKRTLAWNTGVDFNAGSLPQDEAVKAQIKAGLKGHLAAWDPVAQREVWRVQYEHPWNGGALSTAGDLVFQGDALGEFAAYDARTGAKLWSVATGTGILAPPVTYEVGGEQYVAIEVGWGGAFGLAAGELARDAHIATNAPRVFAFKLGGTAAMPPPGPPPRANAEPPPDVATAATVEAGKALYHTVLRHLPRRLGGELGRAAGPALLDVSRRPDTFTQPGARRRARGARHDRLRRGALGRGCRADPRLRDPPRARNEACGCGRGRRSGAKQE